MKQDAITAIAMFCVGTVCGAILTAMILADRTVELSQRELIKHGFAYYTNGPSGYPVFKMKDVK